MTRQDRMDAYVIAYLSNPQFQGSLDNALENALAAMALIDAQINYEIGPVRDD